MDWLAILAKIFEVCVIPLLGLATVYLVQFIRAKSAEINTKHDNVILEKYVTMLSETIAECVIATNQTYVEALKEANAFDAEAQKKAFELTYTSVMNILSAEAKEYLSTIYGDLNAYITNRIEAMVNNCK